MDIARAYAMGRNSVHYELPDECPFEGGEFARFWQDGRRDAAAEERLNQDTEWD